MKIIPMFLKELEQEAQITRKFLSIIPADKFDWQAHPKSMLIRQLATHITELPEWIPLAINTSGLDFAQNPYKPELLNSVEELLATLDKNVAAAITSLENVDEEILNEQWTLRNGDAVLLTCTKAEMSFAKPNYTSPCTIGCLFKIDEYPNPGQLWAEC